MTKFIIRRLFQLIPVLLGVTVLVFSLMHLTPGNPAVIMAGESAPEATVKAIEARLGLNDPLYEQYFRFLGNAVQLDFGSSIRDNIPVFNHISARFAITFELSVMAMIFSVFWGLLAGIISAVRRYTFEDVAMMVVALFGLSMPNFWLGLMLIQWFAIEFQIFKPTGWGSIDQNVLPVITLGTAGAAIIARMTRSSMLDVIDQDYIRTARAKGVKEGTVILRHALKNAMIPVITVIGIQFGSFLAGSVLTESVFAINGLGRLIIDSILQRDFPVVQGAILVIAVVFVIVNLVVDITYRLLNKRVDLN
ncbi:Glutathione transport system permease protein GsiC [Jeotgalicoccus saudimassiliensis]|uniref:Glutathione transport system permease protein GsiC n=1 Tax=Jeotgalicoccus saudimassiliensis TaxID=1461582 RepID=A0A078M288_9STAP|nr:ABC transporter permease [Jeotgalicoccus saudimassiliensis]CDZ98946.1 Glutathione transport system permease protein GsiC [Jeotgalicoccus saudimassiliensis]